MEERLSFAPFFLQGVLLCPQIHNGRIVKNKIAKLGSNKRSRILEDLYLPYEMDKKKKTDREKKVA